jgi:acyl-CoA thioesterase-1
MIARILQIVAALALALACARTEPKAAGATRDSTDVPPPPPGTDVTTPAIVFLGTSLTAGLGLDPEQAYPAIIQQKLDSARLRYRVVNAGVSGETSAGARRRLDWLLRQPVAVLVIETGANDGLRGQDPDSVRANIQAIIDDARSRGPAPRIVLAGMEAPPNFGPIYVRRFHAIYSDLARANRVAFVPFLLRNVAGVDSLNQADGIHPTAAGQRIVAKNVWTVLERVLR